MTKIVVALLGVVAISLISGTESRSQQNSQWGTPGQPFASQLMMTALAEPGSPQVGKEVQVADELYFSVGYRLWLNYWQTSAAKTPATVNATLSPGTGSTTLFITNIGDPPTINQFAAASIPSVGVRYKDFFGSASVMISPYYYFPTASEIVQAADASGGRIQTFRLDHKVRGSRIEADVNFGYSIHPWIALTMGYKGVFQKFRDKGTAVNLTLQSGGACRSGGPIDCGSSFSSKSEPSYNGGTIGIAANIPIPPGGLIGSGFSLYGNGGGGPMASNDFSHAWYGTVDAGLAYKTPGLPLLFTIGYKFQIINSNTESGAPQNHIIDYTRGAILGVNFVF